jgi:hypothetical protein
VTASAPVGLFGRKVRLEFGTPGTTGKAFDDLRIGFRVDMSRESTPNKARIVAYNFNADSVALLQKPDAVIRLLVGYDVPRLIFEGNPIKHGVRQTHDGPDRILAIEAQDGGRAYQHARVDVSYAAQTSYRKVFDAVALATGLPLGTVQVPDGTFAQGLVLAGTARGALDTLAAATGCHWFIRDGVLHFLDADGDTGETAPVFSAKTGNLIGSPVPTDDGLEVRALLDPSVRPGRKFKVEAREHTGVYVARDVTFEGDNGYETPFYVTTTGKAYVPGGRADVVAKDTRTTQTYTALAWQALGAPTRALLTSKYHVIVAGVPVS